MISRTARQAVEAMMIPANYVRTEDDTLVFECGEYSETWVKAYEQAEKVEAALGISVAVI